VRAAKLRAGAAHGHSVLALFYGPRDADVTAAGHKRSLDMLAIVERHLQLSIIEPLYKHFKVVLFTVRLWRAVSTADWSRALKLVLVLLELLAPESDEAVQEIEYLEMRLVHAQLVERLNPERAALEFLYVIDASSRLAYVALHGEASLLYTISQYKQHPFNMEPSLILLRTVKAKALKHALPTLEYLVVVAYDTLKNISSASRTSSHS